MTTVLLIIHLLVATGLVALVLMQRSEGGALGIGGGGGGMMAGRGSANMLTRATMILGAVFMANSILLAVISGVDGTTRSVIDRLGDDGADGLPFTFDDAGIPATPEDQVEPDATPMQPPADEADELPEIPGR